MGSFRSSRRFVLVLALFLLSTLLAVSSAEASPVARVGVRQISGTGGGVVTFGHVFPAGQVPGSLTAQDAGGAALPTQVDVRRRHPDGSVRHAVLSVQVPGSVDLQLVPTGTVAKAPGFTISEALAGGFEVEVEVTAGGKTFRASAAHALRSAAVERALDGTLATELRVAARLAAADGSTFAPLAVSFDTRFLTTDAARVSVAFENAWHDTPGDLTYDVRIVSRGAVVFEKAGVSHHHHSRWRHIVSWGDVPRFVVTPDVPVLIAAGAIPRYDLARRRVPVTAVDKLFERWQASNRDVLGNGIVYPKMGAPGGRMDIGPLPTWTVLALLSGDPRAWEVTLDAGDRAGAFPIHYRDRATGRPMNIDVHPTVSLTNGRDSQPADKLPACTTCTSPYAPDTEHQPSLAYIPYLLTGDLFYLDEMHFWASHNFIKQNFSYRERSNGLLKATNQTRAQAWTMRNLATAAWIVPDNDPDRAYLEDKLRRNLAWFRDFAVPANPLGQWGVTVFSLSEFPAEVGWHVRNWQIDFFTVVAGWMVDLGYTDAATLRNWLAGNVVGRFENLTPAYATAYHLAGGDDFDNWYTDWATILRLSPPPDTSTWAPQNPNHYQAHAMAALTEAVRAELPKAASWLTWLEGQTIGANAARYDADPTWALVTRGSDTPTPPPPPPPPPPPAPPAAPSNLTGQAVSAKVIRLSWADNSSDETSFQIEQLVGGAFREVRRAEAGVTTLDVTGLKARTQYTFRVRAANAAGLSAASNTVQVTTPSPGGGGGGQPSDPVAPPPPSSAVPAAPSQLTGEAISTNTVRLSWQDNSDNETQFRVDQVVNGLFREVLATEANVTSGNIGGLTAGHTYRFRVRAFNAAGFSAPTKTLWVVVRVR